MGRDLLLALCLWSFILAATCEFSNDAVRKVTGYMQQKVIQGFWKTTPHHAYVVKLTEEECNIRKNPNNPALITDIPEAFFNAIDEERKKPDMKAAMTSHGIYSGNRILMATIKEVTKNINGREVKYTEHAEYRLLFPGSGQTVSPAQNFMNKEPKAQCVIFYSLISPCVDKCINPNGQYSILNKLQNDFQSMQDRAIVYKFVYQADLQKLNNQEERVQVLNSWKGLNDIMAMFRCYGKTCRQCFENGDVIDYCTKDKP